MSGLVSITRTTPPPSPTFAPQHVVMPGPDDQIIANDTVIDERTSCLECHGFGRGCSCSCLGTADKSALPNSTEHSCYACTTIPSGFGPPNNRFPEYLGMGSPRIHTCCVCYNGRGSGANLCDIIGCIEGWCRAAER